MNFAERSNAETESKIRHVDLRDHKSHIRMIENLDNHRSPVKHPSKIQIMDTKERFHHFFLFLNKKKCHSGNKNKERTSGTNYLKRTTEMSLLQYLSKLNVKRAVLYFPFISV